GPRERTRRDEETHAVRSAEDAEFRAACHVGGFLDLDPVAQVGLVGAVTQHRVGERQPRKRAHRWLTLDRLERRDDARLEYVEHVFLLCERELEIELPKLELPVGPQVFVTPARRDLVVA